MPREKNWARKCLNCGSDKTTIGKSQKGTPYEKWSVYNNGYLCHNCDTKLWRKNNPEKVKEYSRKWDPINHMKNNPKRQHYKGKDIYHKENPRKGTCVYCSKKGNTQLHHFAEYHDDDPLRDTIELCPSCHMKESWRLKQI